MKKLGLYVHIPFCKSKCGYCNFNSMCDTSQIAAYASALLAEADGKSRECCDYQFDSIYFGGGTPSILKSDVFVKITDGLKSAFHFADGAEFSVECNPESVTQSKLDVFKSCGVNRISLGVQSLSDETLQAIGRVHRVKEVYAAIDAIRSRFDNFSVDFMLNLPHQNIRDINAMIDFVHRYGIPHVSAYSLKLEEGTPMYGKFEQDDDLAADMYDTLRSGLSELGLDRYEISNFARCGAKCRHNLKYWHAEEYLGLGVSAHSYVGTHRFFNTSLLPLYMAGGEIEAGRESIQGADAMFEYIMLHLRTRDGFAAADFEGRFGCRFSDRYRAAISQCGELLVTENGRVRVREDAFYVINNLLINFL